MTPHPRRHSLFTALLGLCCLALTACAQSNIPRISPTEAAAQVAAGEAILIDVREAAEWADTGVAAPARLHALSNLRGDRSAWAETLADAKAHHTPLLLYCRSGNRSGQAAAALAAEGFTVANVGGFRDWQAADLPTRAADEPPAKSTP
ncbi:rhodanese-like domain-containing protein [Actomonas aquatica]|uniref:Rhodanese-like domain-containing protein n=1 Tax=Actomonas aquatica TaxID=2866162 RepID=A0ABZ1C856_9BACT|nr:rhodanese-like domain-containing protein [Opitutus sp. WL0086]WRQ86490.1 rhodanese-like domain-containing protein [Opitutus sp. WL0086]